MNHFIMSHYIMNNFVRSLAAGLLAASLAGPALAVDTLTSKDAPDLAVPRAMIAAQNWSGARAELGKLINGGVQHADVYSLMGYVTRQLGDYRTSLTFYNKALDFDPNHRAAREYLGELYVLSGDLPKANEQLTVLKRLCPSGCEEREDLEKAIAAKS